MKNSTAHFPLTTGRPHAPQLHAQLGKAWQQLLRWWELAEQRRKLALLDESALQDLGLSRADALRESARSFRDDPLAESLPTRIIAPAAIDSLLP